MKKLLALLLVLVMLFSFAACSGEDTADKNKEKKTQETQEEAVNPSVPRGVVDGNKYTSTYSGLTITLPEGEGWKITSDEDLASDMKISTSLLKEDLYAALGQTDVVTDFEAVDSATGSTVQVTYEFSVSTAETYLNGVKSKMDSLSGVEYEVVEEGKSATLGGKEYVTAVFDKEAVGTTSTLYYFVRATDDGIIQSVLVTVFSGYEGDVSAMLS